MNFIIAGGGSGGHISPALAIADQLMLKGHTISYIGNTNSMEEKLVKAEGLEFLPINVQKLYRKITLAHLRFPGMLIRSIRTCMKYLEQTRATAVICTGGYISGPIAIAAILKKVDLYFWDGNSYPGLTTRYLAKRMKVVFTAFDAASQYLKGANCRNLWIPLRKKPVIKEAIKLDLPGISGENPLLLITGGSQGSMAINEAVAGSLERLLAAGFEILWQAGKIGFSKYKAQYGSTPGLYLFEFTTQMSEMMQAANLAVSRAGALSIAELQEYHVPTILVPLPTAAENHQYFNAKEQQKRGLAMLLEQSKLNSSSLYKAILALWDHRENFMKQFSTIAANTSAEDIADYILSFYTEGDN
ncbi:MAG TPA: UDP-N-acetylglucosamine--N-acetylmuramyl-(pentapeptide) pyrophosphoryl-undecaprenol N-acetylglucosamine transferase [Candidatus Cloacimonadota bacterium]|nr:UDP-N-acetylglucosamine--N-acetylmuramyl-(pentapeptide) pyrophosphoryl-undecaprenol N-acetylglucosamine transferase [Candidatus Cloacimonadota bacterium]